MCFLKNPNSPSALGGLQVPLWCTPCFGRARPTLKINSVSEKSSDCIIEFENTHTNTRLRAKNTVLAESQDEVGQRKHQCYDFYNTDHSESLELGKWFPPLERAPRNVSLTSPPARSNKAVHTSSHNSTLHRVWRESKIYPTLEPRGFLARKRARGEEARTSVYTR